MKIKKINDEKVLRKILGASPQQVFENRDFFESLPEEILARKCCNMFVVSRRSLRYFFKDNNVCLSQYQNINRGFKLFEIDELDCKAREYLKKQELSFYELNLYGR